MKKTILILIAAALLASCDNWLAEKPESFIGPDQIEDSESGVDVWVSGVYANYLDDMFRWASETLENVSRRKEFLRYVQEGFLQEQEHFHAQSEADAERVRKAIEEKRARLLSGLEESQNRMKSEFEETRTVLKEKLDDITQFFDRYL